MPKRPEPSGHTDTCPHCRRAVAWKHLLEELPVVSPHDPSEEGPPSRQTLDPMRCPGCKMLVIDLVDEFGQQIDVGFYSWSEEYRSRLYPEFGGVRPALESELIPPKLRQLYNEAVAIESQSIRGACALLRLCLEALLIRLGFKGELIQQIDAAVKADLGWPHALLSKLQLVRLLGNFGVHWSVDDKGEMVDLDEAELEAMFAAVEQFFRVVFVDPKTDTADIERINKKLEKAGKPMRIGAKGAMVDVDGNPWPPKKVKAVP